jgi:hypothetical protein
MGPLYIQANQILKTKLIHPLSAVIFLHATGVTRHHCEPSPRLKFCDNNGVQSIRICFCPVSKPVLTVSDLHVVTAIDFVTLSP